MSSRSAEGGSYASGRLSLLCGDRFCRAADHVEHRMRLGKHRDVTAAQLHSRSAHPFGYEAFEIRMDRTILASHDVPARLRAPSDAVMLLVEQVRGRREVGSINDLLLFFGE